MSDDDSTLVEAVYRMSRDLRVQIAHLRDLQEGPADDPNFPGSLAALSNAEFDILYDAFYTMIPLYDKLQANKEAAVPAINAEYSRRYGSQK
jgi:hypothetical protein